MGQAACIFTDVGTVCTCLLYTSALPSRTKDGQPFELLANCFGPEDIDTAMQSGAQGVGLLLSLIHI